MRIRTFSAALLLIGTAAPVWAESKPVVSFGYALATYLEEDGGAAPFGIYFLLGSPGPFGVDFDVAYHRDTFDFGNIDYTLHTATVMIGPRFGAATGTVRPFGRGLFGGRYDKIENNGTQALGGMLGGGLDAAIGEGTYFRFAADFQMFFDEGEELKVLRLSLGLCFQ